MRVPMRDDAEGEAFIDALVARGKRAAMEHLARVAEGLDEVGETVKDMSVRTRVSMNTQKLVEIDERAKGQKAAGPRSLGIVYVTPVIHDHTQWEQMARQAERKAIEIPSTEIHHGLRSVGEVPGQLGEGIREASGEVRREEDVRARSSDQDDNGAKGAKGGR